MKYSIRLMERKDLLTVVAAERQCYSHPWSEELFLRELANPLAQIHLYLLEERVAGYLCSWLIADELQIHNVAVLPEFRRRGIASELIRTVVEQFRTQRLDRVLLEVRVGNESAIALYRSFGFQEVARRKRYYPDGEDALVMELVIASAADAG